MDLYLISGISLISLTIVESFIVSKDPFGYRDTTTLTVFENYLILVYTLMWTGFNGVIYIGAKKQWFKQNWNDRLKQEEEGVKRTMDSRGYLLGNGQNQIGVELAEIICNASNIYSVYSIQQIRTSSGFTKMRQAVCHSKSH